jgi:hypothetical protein
MAVAAEQFILAHTPEAQIQDEQASRRLRLADQPLLDAVSLVAFSAEPTSRWLSADELPSLRTVREQSEADAHQILEEKHEFLNEGEFEKVGYAFDVLSKAKKLVAIEKTDGKNSERYHLADAGFELDCQRHRDEARRRESWEYFPEIEQTFDTTADSFVYGDYVMKEVVVDGLTPVGAEKIGVEALVSNYKEEHVSVAVSKLGKLMLKHAGVENPAPEIRTITVSQIETSPQVMVWSQRYDSETGDRFLEQVALPRKNITHEVIVEAMKRKGSVEPDAKPSRQEVNDTQSISLDRYGVLEFAALLDEVASELSGKNIFMGAEVSADTIKDYAGIPAQAAERQAENPEEVNKLKAEVLRLARNNTDGWLANRLIEDFVTDMFFTKAKLDPVTAGEIFGEKTANDIQQALTLRQQGDIYAAERIIEATRAEAPRVTVCAGGSCGLESVNQLTLEGQSIARAVGAKAGDTVVKDKERKCPNPGCGKKEIVYAYSSREVKKKCLGCGKGETKATPKRTVA